MLTQSDFINIGKQAAAIYESLELELIKEIATRIANVGYANTVVLNDIQIAQEMGALYSDVIALVAKYNNASYEKIAEIFNQAGVKTLDRDDFIYKEAGLNPVPIKKSRSIMQIISATVEKTSGNLQNLVMTTANTSQTQFYNAMNKAYMEVSTGVKSYSQSIIDVIKDIGSKGASIEYPSGRKYSLESAVRMNIITGVNQTCGKLQELRANEMGWDLMELTAHGGARPEHAEWQGKIVSRSGKKGYLSLDDIGYGEATGFKGVNCRHDWYPYLKGSTRTYTQEQLNTWKNEKVTYNGKEYSKYDATQIQREMERQMRKDKKELAGFQGILTSDSKDKKLLEDTRTEFARRSLIYKTHQNELDDFIQQTSFVKDNTRLYIGKQDKSIGTQVANVTKIANKYNNSDIIGSKVNGVEITEIGEHIISRTYARNVAFEDVQDTLKNPVECGKIVEDSKGRRSFYVYGKKVTVAVNPDTGKIATVRDTSRREKKRYGIEE
jgi:hypothetical protein